VLWILLLLALKSAAGAVGIVVLVVAWLGVVALSRRVGAVTAIRAVVVVNLVVMAAQIIGAWGPLLGLVGGSVTVHNSGRLVTGLTSSTGDVACVLAMSGPFLLAGRWRYLLVPWAIALLWTQALSGIVAGVVALLVALWPSIRPKAGMDGRLATWGVCGLVAALVLGRGEIASAWGDERWTVWGAALARWTDGNFWTGHGIGSWAAQNFAVVDEAAGQVQVWETLHFDLLQHGYEAGLIGVALVMAAWVALCWRSASVGNRAALGGLAALAVCQFGHFPLHTASGTIVAAMVVGEGMSVMDKGIQA
jgi:hypothetical protein